MEEETDKEQEEWLKINILFRCIIGLFLPIALYSLSARGEPTRLPPNTNTPFYCL